MSDWFTGEVEPTVPDVQTRLNYVIPNKLQQLLNQYCAQTEMKPGPLVRRLISDFVKGEIVVEPEKLQHPKGRRTSVDLPLRLLESFELHCEQIKSPSKAAIIAALLGDFLPSRVDLSEKVKVEVPASIYKKIYDRYGPGPTDEVIIEALCDLIQKNQMRAIPAEQEV